MAWDHYTFADRQVAEQAAEIVGGWIELEPLMDASSLRGLRTEYSEQTA